MKLQSTKTQASLVFEGVEYTVKLMTERDRARLQMENVDDAGALATAQSKAQAIEDRYAPEVEDYDPLDPEKAQLLLAKMSTEDRTEHDRHMRQIDMAQIAIRDRWLRAGLKGVSGVTIEEDGSQATVEQFLELADDRALNEAFLAITKRAELSEEEQKNS